MEWLEKIRDVWNQLEYHHNPACIQIEDKLRDNRQLIQKLKNENTFESEVLNFKQQKLTAKVNQKIKNDQTTKQSNKQVEAIEEKIRQAIHRRDFLSQWGFNNYVISYRIKVRMMEDLIDKAQRLRTQPNSQLEQEL